MNFSCVFVLALALFGASCEGYVSSVYPGVGYGGVCGTGVGTAYGAGYATGVGAAYASDYDAGYGCRTASVCGGSVCDTCQCVKTIVRPTIVERIPYSCSRRVQPSACRTGYGLYSGNLYGRTGAGALATGAGYLNNGYVVV